MDRTEKILYRENASGAHWRLMPAALGGSGMQHLWREGTDETSRDPEDYYRNNIAVTRAVLERDYTRI